MQRTSVRDATPHRDPRVEGLLDPPAGHRPEGCVQELAARPRRQTFRPLSRPAHAMIGDLEPRGPRAVGHHPAVERSAAPGRVSAAGPSLRV
ncbi:hypothetical protein MIPYR_40090 [uncultured Microbacterium sp.]|uniref:Uncharacterized protein n=1 Tax=uncultured Microbacterium sp. TaxID=191216 RepID=A0A1Y5P3R8_9MICO|nr:hypothetical protein MIPYR_40090 [uncultured Microbacterium sp.]